MRESARKVRKRFFRKNCREREVSKEYQVGADLWRCLPTESKKNHCVHESEFLLHDL
jgi:hypothetical protein